jgi:hypothetical protein
MLGHEGALFGRQYSEDVTDERGTHLVLRYDHAGAVGSWSPTRLRPGTPFGPVTPLFEKLDPDTVRERMA